ncbi:MAG TPA: DNA internalization-related competence protein ComEC/Rec2 [Ureibacillus sp.]|nr:DNA internalization-related competence protein ComEC/Rec2 [Ureibacillus sp.]
MISLKHKWIYYALSILVASLAAHESIRLLLLLIPFTLLLYVKKIHIYHIVGIVFVTISSFTYFSQVLLQLDQPLQLPSLLVWTDEYKMNGDTLRGFMEDSQGRSIYVVYKLESEYEKQIYQRKSLVGSRYLVRGELVEPNQPNHDFAFNMEKYLKSKGSLGIVEITDWQYIEKNSTILDKLAEQRFHVKTHIEDTFPSTLIAEAQALIIGLQDNVDEETTRSYQKLGITHLFAISGLHIEIVAFIFYQGLLRLKIRKEFASIVLMIILPTYAILAGGTPSVWRAVTVVELIMISRIKGKMAIDDALSISFIIFVFIAPWSIYQIGFQLSYLATVSLIFSGSIINRYSSWIIQSFLITFVSQLLVYPLLLYNFYELSLSSLLVNIFFVPLFSFIILPINILLLVISYCSIGVTNLFFTLYEPLRNLLTQFIHLLQAVPYQMWNPGKPSDFLMVIAYASVFTTFYFLDTKAKLVKVLIVLILPASVIHVTGKLTNNLIITFINVGQGDCTVIELPFREEVYLIDTGGLLRFNEEEWKTSTNQYEVGRDIVVPFLKGKGIHKIDKLILTHADSDHMEGAEEILQEIHVKEIHISPNSFLKEVMVDLLTEAQHQKIPVVEQMANTSWKIGEVFLSYLWPRDTDYEGNNDSLVLYLSKGSFSGLFMGDVEEEGERSILEFYPNIGKVDVLKAGHHGSKTSSSKEFIEKIRPRITIFSAGVNNRYGHPSPEIVERFQDLGLPTLTTSEVGTIELKINGNELRVKTSNQQ